MGNNYSNNYTMSEQPSYPQQPSYQQPNSQQPRTQQPRTHQLSYPQQPNINNPKQCINTQPQQTLNSSLYGNKNQLNHYLKNITQDQINKLQKLSPYVLLNLDNNSTMEDLKLKFKELVSIVHPDRGGNKQLFNILYNSYKQIENNIYQKEQKTQEELKDTFKNESHNLLKNQNKIKFEINKFNKLFNENNSNDNNNIGYSNFLKDDIKKEATSNNKIIEFQIPESYNNSNYHCNLLVGSNNNFSDSCEYSDIKEAYAPNKNIDTSTIEHLYNRDFKTIEQERTNIKMSELEQEKYNKYQQKLKQHEKTYYNSVISNDKNISDNFNRINRKMINM